MRQLKAFLWRCYLISRGFSETLEQKSARECVLVFAYAHSCVGACPSALLSVWLSGSSEKSRFGNVAFYGHGSRMQDSVAFLITMMLNGLNG